jgi:hypothetical protein
LGQLYKKRGLQKEAEASLKRALRIRLQFLGSECLQTASVQEELGKLYMEKGDYSRSFDCLNVCYETRKTVFRQ